MAVKLDNELGGRAVQVRVVQGKEPDHFMAIFGGKLVIYSGGRASSFEAQEGEKDEVLGDTFMLQVRGNANHNTKAVQVIKKPRHLNDFTNNIDFSNRSHSKLRRLIPLTSSY